MPDIWADPSRIHLIVQNLLENAIKYTGKGGAVRAIFKKQGNYLRGEIIDNGVGISSDEQARVFQKFFRSDNARRNQVEGTGLGHVATEEAEKSWVPALKKAISKNMTICFAAQTLYGRLDPYVYSPGRELLDLGIIYLEDILPETAYVKLGHVLGHSYDKEKIREMMLENLAGEFSTRIEKDTFMY